jgi:hypothetical protein
LKADDRPPADSSRLVKRNDRRNDRRWLWLLAGGLLAASVVLYLLEIIIFDSPRDTFFYIFQDLAFLPLTVLIVGLIIEQLISVREKRAMTHKLNMVIGAFFSELGMPLLGELLPAMCSGSEIREQLHVKASWKKDDFSRAAQFARALKCEVDLDRVDREALKSHLIVQRHFVLRLLENPNLMEHQRFTDLLWAVLHLEEELEARTSLTDLVPADEAHLRLDVRRAYNALLVEWLFYVEHLKADYPYLFSLVVRTHPFQDKPSPVVTE